MLTGKADAGDTAEKGRMRLLCRFLQCPPRMLLVLLLSALVPSMGSAQGSSAIVGRVVDAATGVPLRDVEVWLESGPARRLTDSTGRYGFYELAAGTQIVNARRLGYAAYKDTLTIFAYAENLFDLRLVAQPATLDTVRSVAEGKKYISPQLRDFEERRRKGIGRFITEEEIRKYDHTTLVSVLPKLPGGYLVNHRSNTYFGSNRGGANRISARPPQADPSIPGSPRGCWAAVYLDGVPIYRGPPDAAPDFARMQAREYAGIEFYRGAASVPSQWGGVKASDCGVLLLWTRER